MSRPSRPPTTKWFAATYDAIQFAQLDRAYDDWKSSALTPEVLADLETFVTSCIPNRGAAQYVANMEGAFNLALHLRFEDGTPVVFRIPQPCRLAADLADEKVTNEANWMEYVKTHTTIPIPHIYRWGCAAENPTRIPGPFILMDFVEGEKLYDVYDDYMKDPVLKDRLHADLADVFLQLDSLHFDAIGSISKDPISGTWAVRHRPLTQDMIQLALGVPDYPTHTWPTGPFRRSADYFRFIADQHQTQLRMLRNISVPAQPEEDEGSVDLDDRADNIARFRFQARLAVAKLAEASLRLANGDNIDSSFSPFNLDIGPRNMLVDPSGHITGIIDLEFTNAMPTRFASGPPLWLLWGLDPSVVLRFGNYALFEEHYRNLLTPFLDALKKAEEERAHAGESSNAGSEPPLSARMLESWDSGRCWLDFALNSLHDVDRAYWAALHDPSHAYLTTLHGAARITQVLAEAEAETEKFVKFSREQVMDYERSEKAFCSGD